MQASSCPECRVLEPGQMCVYCHQDRARLEREDRGQSMADAERDDSDWIEHVDVCVYCRRNNKVQSRAILRATCPRWAEWGGPTPWNV